MARPKPSQMIAARLKEARLRLFATAAEASDALGVNATTLRTHEAGTRGVPLADLERYARRYGVALDWLISGKGDQEPSADSRPGLIADSIPIGAVIQDDRWHPGDLDGDQFPGFGMRKSLSGLPEAALYDDPRFPPEVLSALLVRTERTDGPYLDGTVVFVVDVADLGMRPGDHVVVLHHRSGFVEWTLREITTDNTFRRLLSEGDDTFAPDDETWIVGVVVGAVVRRPVPSLDLASRKAAADRGVYWSRRGKENDAT